MKKNLLAVLILVICSACVLCFALSGCKKKEEVPVEDSSFIENVSSSRPRASKSSSSSALTSSSASEGADSSSALDSGSESSPSDTSSSSEASEAENSSSAPVDQGYSGIYTPNY